MTTITEQQIRKAVQNKSNWNLEINEPLSTSDGNRYFGVCFGKNKWHWFRQFCDINGQPYEGDFDELSFDHSYSQVNGKTQKGFWHSVKVIDAIKKAANA